ncbi:MAG: outer membrane beta-barrel protein [Bacteroidota bacterium]
MKRYLLLALTICSLAVTAQERPKKTNPKAKVDLTGRSNDHLLFQVGYTQWMGLPDTLKTNGLSKSINTYLMFDFPFKNDSRLSMAFGPGIGSDHILFTKRNIGIKELTPTLRFTNVQDTNHYKKTKLATVYLEAPIEFRYNADPANNKGFKWSIGVKVGRLMNAHTRNTKWESRSGSLLNDYVMKESSSRFFNKTRFVAQARVGLGHVSLFGSYQLTTVIKDGFGPATRPLTFGLTISGL